MKRVVSVSLGSSKRDHRVEVELAGESFELIRRGTDGDFQEAMRVIRELDGEVDAIGLGGIDVYVNAGNKRFAFKDGLKLVRQAKVTPVVDGAGLKNTLERKAVEYLKENTKYVQPGTKVLMVSAVDRLGMAEAFADAGCDLTIGDVIFVLGIPRPIKSPKTLEFLGKTLLPVICRMPFKYIYPTGKKQEKEIRFRARRYARYYLDADIIAGDFHYIKKYFPSRLDGKVIITNTTTRDDVEFFRERGVSALITTTPVLEGRSFGTNVIEGILVALAEKPLHKITVDEYRDLVDRMGINPHIMNLKE